MVQTLDACAAFNLLNPELMNMPGSLADGFFAVDSSAEPLPGCLPFRLGEPLDTDDVCPERWDVAFLFHDGSLEAAEVMMQVEGVKTIMAVNKRDFLAMFPWWPRAGAIQFLDWHLPSKMGVSDLFLASRRAVSERHAINELGICAVVDLSSHGGNVGGVAESCYLRLVLQDSESHADELMALMIPALAFIGRHLAKGVRTVVHCDKGQSRSGAIVVAWLMACRPERDGFLSFEEALAEACVHRASVRPNPGFAAALQCADAAVLSKWRHAALT